MARDAQPEDAPSEFAVDPSPAVAVVDTGVARRASTMAESPARTVAVLDRPESASSESQGPLAEPRAARRMVTLAVALLAVGCGVAVALLVSRSGASDPAPSLASVSEIPTVTFDDAGMSDATAMAADDSVLAGVRVAGVRIVNAESVIASSSSSHRELAIDLGVTLDPAANCWFAALGGELVTTMYCGPVVGAASDDVSYHAFPLSFLEAEGGLEAFEAPSTGLTATPLPVGTVLVGTVEPPTRARGERATAEGE